MKKILSKWMLFLFVGQLALASLDAMDNLSKSLIQSLPLDKRIDNILDTAIARNSNLEESRSFRDVEENIKRDIKLILSNYCRDQRYAELDEYLHSVFDNEKREKDLIFEIVNELTGELLDHEMLYFKLRSDRNILCLGMYPDFFEKTRDEFPCSLMLALVMDAYYDLCSRIFLSIDNNAYSIFKRKYIELFLTKEIARDLYAGNILEVVSHINFLDCIKITENLLIENFDTIPYSRYLWAHNVSWLHAWTPGSWAVWYDENPSDNINTLVEVSHCLDREKAGRKKILNYIFKQFKKFETWDNFLNNQDHLNLSVGLDPIKQKVNEAYMLTKTISNK